MRRLLACLLLALPSLSIASGVSFSGDILPAQVLATTATKVVDLGEISRFSMQAVYADGTPSASGHTISEGKISTATISVVRNSGMLSAVARSSITIISNALTTGQVITINGQTFTEGVQWTKGDVSSNTAISLAAAIDANPGILANAVNNVVFASAAVVGTFANSWAITSSNASALYVKNPTFINGLDAATIVINGVTLTAGTDWTVGVSSKDTAISISGAINSNTSLNSVILASAAPSGLLVGVVYATSTAVGVNAYSLSVSTTALLASGSEFQYGLDTEISVSADTFAETSHGLVTGMRVYITTPTVGAMPTPLIGGTTYFAIKTNDNVYKLATSSMNALNNNAIDITALTSNTTLTVRPVVLATQNGTGFLWQSSNDGTNYTNLSVSSITYTAAGSTLWDFGATNYRYLRMLFLPPTSGGIQYQILMNGRKFGQE